MPDPDTLPRRPRTVRWLAGAAVVGASALVAGPVLAQTDDEDGWLGEVLQALIDDGTLTEAQADAVERALEEARPERPFDGDGRPGPFGGFWGGHGPLLVALDAAAEAIGIEVDELRDSLADGQTLAEVAEANGVDAQAVIDALVAEVQERLDDAVADGRLDAADEADRLADATERITELVEDGLPMGPRMGEWRGGPWHHHDDDTDAEDGGSGDSDSDENGSTDTTEPDTTSPDTTTGGS